MRFATKFFTLTFLLALLSGPGPVAAQAGPPVLAFYYAWFDQNTWSSGQSVDVPAEPYRSADRATIERQVAQAQGAGIDAFVQSWYGPQEANNQTETNFRTLLDVAANTGFRATVALEVSGPFFGDAGAVTNAIATLLATHAQHPAFFRYQGKPVIFFWRQQRFSVEQWAAIRNQLDPNRESYWIAEGTDVSYQAVFDGHHLYTIAWAGSPAAELAKWSSRVQAFETDNGVDRLWIATAMPGYNDTNLPRSNAFAVPRREGAYYRETWQGAIASQPDMMIITSFNEWPEGTHIEPSAGYGNLYLDVTRQLVTELRGSPPPAPAPVEVVPAASRQALAGVETAAGSSQSESLTQAVQQQPPDEPYIRTTDPTNVRGGPSTDFDRLGLLDPGTTVAVVGKNAAGDWWQIEFDPADEGLAWVAAEVVEFVGDSEAVPVVAAPGETVEAEVELPTVEIPAGGVNVRSGPGLSFDLLGRLEEDDVASISGQNEAGDWWQIEYEAGEEGYGWITAALVDFEGDAEAVPVVIVTSEDDIFPTPTATPTAPVVAGSVEATDAVNVRAEPTEDAARVGGLYLGEVADVLAVSEDGEWWQIAFADGPEGLAWVATEFVRFQGDRNAVPIFAIGTPTPTPGPTNTPTPTPAGTPTPTPAPLEFPTEFAPTATSIYEATAAAARASRGTPAPSAGEASAERTTFSWTDIPWGLISIIIVAAFFWFQYTRRRR